MDTDTDSAETVASWSSDIEKVLKDLLDNVDELQGVHHGQVLKLEGQLVLFRVPLILLSALNSVFSVGLSTYIEQQTVSTINCLISLACACISSLELFLQIHRKLEVELASYHSYKTLSIRVAACLKLDREHRPEGGPAFLSAALAEYKNLVEQAIVGRHELQDRLVEFNPIIVSA